VSTPSFDSGAAATPVAEDLRERLRRLETVTDVALSRLDVEELLPELLDRVRDLLMTDTAAVLLLDDSRQFLVATAARGIEEELQQGSRVPVGRGFAGRIALERRPLILGKVTPSTVVNPVLLLKGISSMLGVPLLSGDTVLGVLHVGTLSPRTFTADDVALLEQVADRAAVAVQAGRTHSDAVAARVLQRSFSPQRLPARAGLDLAARYVPGHQMGVGGDWYDVFELPTGLLGIAIGDVMGHGLRSAAIMARLRSALRAYAFEDADPVRVLDRLDRMVQYFEPGQMATVLYGVYDADAGTGRLSSAGHMPPALTRPGRPTEFLRVEADTLLGVGQDGPRHATDVFLPPGGRLCLFTDGLVERRSGGLDDAMGRLGEVLARGFASSDDACAEVMASLVGESHTEDDIALLVLQRAAQ